MSRSSLTDLLFGVFFAPRGWDDLFTKCGENTNSLSAMKLSPYYKVFEDEAASWEEKLNRVHVLFGQSFLTLSRYSLASCQLIFSIPFAFYNRRLDRRPAAVGLPRGHLLRLGRHQAPPSCRERPVRQHQQRVPPGHEEGLSSTSSTSKASRRASSGSPTSCPRSRRRSASTSSGSDRLSPGFTLSEMRTCSRSSETQRTSFES
jgi:hypothetical protein